MEPEVRQHLTTLGTNLQSHPVIKEYRELKVRVDQCLLIKQYEQKIEEAQKEMVHAKHYDKPEAYKYWQKQADLYTKKLDEYPLVVAYRQALIEANDLLQLITTTITEQINERTD